MGKRTIAEPDIDRFQNEVQGKPDERKENFRVEHHQGEHDPAEGEERSGCSFIRTNYQPTLREAFEEVKTGEEFRASKHGGNHGRKTQCCPKHILQGCEYLSADVGPVLGAEVEQFEDPPHGGRDEEQADIFARTAREQGYVGAPDDQPIHAETVSQPQRKEAPMRARTRQRPIENPEEDDEAGP